MGINESSPLIVGGANAERGKYPWQSLLYYNNRFRCGGSLINDKFILTAAHCVQDDIAQRWGRFKIAVGKFKLKRRDTTEQNRLIKTVTVHPDYIPREDQHDVAVLELEMPIVLSSTVQPVILATARFDLMATKWMACYATGFGLVSHDQERLASALQELKTSFISKMQCKTMAQKLFNARASITKPTTCTQDMDAGVCNGDSGGPGAASTRTGRTCRSACSPGAPSTAPRGSTSSCASHSTDAGSRA